MSGDQAPAVQQFGSAVLLQGPVVDVWRLVALGVRAANRDGIGLARVTHLQAVLAAAAAEVRAAAAECGHADVAQLPTEAVSDPSEPLTTREVATMLGLSPRQTQRMARTLEARQLRSGRLIFDRGAVESYLAAQPTRKATPA